MLGTKFVRKPVALHAEPGFQRIFWVINAGVVDSTVARAGGHAELRKLLDKKNVLPALGDGACDGTADNATADNQNIGLIHFYWSPLISSKYGLQGTSRAPVPSCTA